MSDGSAKSKVNGVQQVRITPANRFRGEIREAVANGVGLGGLLLRLTYTDESRLVRDRETLPGEIRFDDGVMSFLGVKVQRGGVEASVLESAVPTGDE